MERADTDIEAFWSQYAPAVVRRCRQLLRDEDEALDVAQDVFVELLRRRDSLQIRYPSSLLYRIATNRCLNRLRDNRLREQSEAAHGRAALEEPSLPHRQADARLALRQVFARHRQSTRRIAALHFACGLTLEEVAGRVGLSVSGVRKRLRVLQESLRRLEET